MAAELTASSLTDAQILQEGFLSYLEFVFRKIWSVLVVKTHYRGKSF